MEPIDQVFLIVEGILEDIRKGDSDYGQFQEVKKRQDEMYMIFLQMEVKLLGDLNSIHKPSKDVLDRYAYSMRKAGIRKSICELEEKLLDIENLTLAQAELEGETLPQIYFHPDGKPELNWFPGECNDELLAAIEYNRNLFNGDDGDSTPP